jgi:hypothetical protein
VRLLCLHHVVAKCVSFLNDLCVIFFEISTCELLHGSECKFLANAVAKGPSTLAFYASVSTSAMASLPNCFLCYSRAITYLIAQRKQLGGGAIADGETDAKNASVDGPLAVPKITQHTVSFQ